MHALYSRLAAEWQDLHITYPEWLTHIAMNPVYYTLTVVVSCVTGFEVGMIIGIVV